MHREFILICFALAMAGRLDDVTEFFALNREFLSTTTRLSPEDQARLDTIFERASASSAKMDAALSQN